MLFVLVNCLGGIRIPGNSVCRLTDRLRHDPNSVCLAVKRQSNKIHNIKEPMAKTHAYSGFNGWHILLSLVLFVDSWYSKVIEIKLMIYISLASQNSKLERKEAFSAEIILYLIRTKGNYLTFLEFSQFRGPSILQQKEICEAYTFHIIYRIQCMKHKHNVLLPIFYSLCIKRKKTMET